ncbi:hypothetical protein HDU81_004938 [Chytriomyces hyalinus]|nr:hypothetical protein HDU81_004938 [Chytriomyces hyalinus]
MASKSGLDKAVSSLAAGAGADSVSDRDLEAYVASLIAAEAKTLGESAKVKGISAYSEADRKRRMPKPNTRFLSSLMQQTDSHNYSLILEENKRSRELLDDIESKGSRSHRHSAGITAASSKADDNTKTISNQSIRNHSKDGVVDRNHDSHVSPKSRAPPTASATIASDSPVLDQSSQSATPVVAVKRQVRGRGTVSMNANSSRLDKYFDSAYNPRLDIDNYDDTSLIHYVDALQAAAGAASGGEKRRRDRSGERKEKKKRKEKKRKKKERRKEKKKEMKERKVKSGEGVNDEEEGKERRHQSDYSSSESESGTDS